MSYKSLPRLLSFIVISFIVIDINVTMSGVWKLPTIIPQPDEHPAAEPDEKEVDGDDSGEEEASQ